MWIAYCKTCKETVAWGNVESGLGSLTHSTEEMETKVTIIDGEEITVIQPISHECGVVEVPDTDTPSKEYFDSEYSELMV